MTRTRLQSTPFRVLKPLGRGGMGEVWLGEHAELDVRVAIKVMTGEAARRPSYLERFHREIRAMARLHHPAIIQVYDFGELTSADVAQLGPHLSPHSPYFVMELAEGGSLLDHSPTTWDEARHILLQLLDALAHAHARGVVHRDLKPANTLIRIRGRETTDDPFSCRSIRDPGTALAPNSALCVGRAAAGLAAPRHPNESSVFSGPLSHASERALKLTDFGIAQASDGAIRRGMVDRRILGTPEYMAPEQILGRFRDQGPWTDLYALGCLAYQLLVGIPPYRDADKREVLNMQLAGPSPILLPRFPVPKGVEGWIARLLAKRPIDRFECAADAAYELTSLEDRPLTTSRGSATQDDQPRSLVSPVRGHLHKAPTISLATMPVGLPLQHWAERLIVSDPLSASELSASEPGVSELSASAPAASSSAVDSQARSTPALATQRLEGSGPVQAQEGRRGLTPIAVGINTRPPAAGPPPLTPNPIVDAKLEAPLIGTGLGLFGARPPPMVGRETERRALWGALTEVHKTGAGRMVLVSGPPGVGKSRLALWIAETACERGAAISLRLQCDPGAAADNSIARMVASHLTCMGLTEREMRFRVGALLGASGATAQLGDAPADYETSSVVELMRPVATPQDELSSPEGRFRFFDQRERWTTLLRWMALVAAQRPVVLWVDDLHWSEEIGQVLRFLTHPSRFHNLRLLIVATFRDQVVTASSESYFPPLLDRASLQVLRLTPLSPSESERFVRSLLPLSGSLAQRLAERSAGNPLFAVQLLDSVVQANRVKEGDNGWEMSSGEQAEIPTNLEALWLDRLAQLARRLSPDAPDRVWQALELAVALGAPVAHDAWHALSEAIDYPDAPVLFERLLAQGLATGDTKSWRFAHRMLSERLEDHARAAGRWQRHHALCADVLSQPAETSLERRERRCYHLVEADRADEAIGPLLDVLLVRRREGLHARALELTRLLERALAQAGLGQTDAGRGDLFLARADIYRLMWNLKEAERWAQAAVDAADEHGWARVEGEGLFILTHVHRLRGDRTSATALCRAALKRFTAAKDDKGVANAHLAMAILAREGGDWDEALTRYDNAQIRFEALEATSGVANCLLGVGHLHLQHGALEEAQACYQKAKVLYETLNDRVEVAGCINSLAEIHRQQGRLEAAETGYRRAAKLYERLGTQAFLVPKVNLGLVLIERGRFKSARRILTRALVALQATGQRGFIACALVFLLPCDVAAGKLDGFEAHLLGAQKHLDATQLVERDVARIAERTAEMLLGGGESTRARAVLKIAEHQWRALGEAGRADDVAARISALGSQ